MAGNRRDVNLVIRAKDEASRAFEQATTVLEQLVGINAKVGSSAQNAGSELAQLGQIALTLDNIFGKVNTAANSAAEGMGRQKAAIAAQRSELANLRTQAQETLGVITRLNSAENVVNAGRNQGPRVAQVQEATREYDRLVQAINKVKASLALSEAEMQEQQSSLQQIGSTTIAVENAREQLNATIQRGTAAMRAQAQAAGVLAAVERNTGVTRDDSDYDALVGQIRRTAEARDVEIAKMRAEEQATLELSRAKQAQIGINNALAAGNRPVNFGGGKSARDSGAVFTAADNKELDNLGKALRDAAMAAQSEAGEIAHLKNELNPLAAAEANLATQQQKLNRWFREGKIDAKELDVSLKILDNDFKRLKNSTQGIDAKGRPSLFGLKPYEAQNFAFQINDIITQLASGTSLSQTLAQQGGQLIQLFPKVGSAIIGAFKSGPILAFIATIGTLVLAINSAADAAERLRKFDGILAANADGAAHSAVALSQAAKQLDLYGLSAEEALKVTRTLLAEGFDDSQILALGQSSKDLADILGIDVTDAARQVADAFNGNYDAIKKLDDATNFLSGRQRDHVKDLFLEGKAQEARSYALGIFTGKMDDAAGKMRGSWSEGARSLSNAWSTFMEAIADTGLIDHMGDAMDKLGRKVTNLIDRIRGVRELQNVDNDIKEIEDRVEARNSGGGGIIGPAVIDMFSGSNAREDAEKLNRLYQERERILGHINQSQSDNAGQTRELTELQKKQNSDLLSATNQLKAQGDLLTDKQRIQIAYNEGLLEAQKLAPNSARELQIQYALTKQKIEQTRLETIRRREAEQAAAAAKREREEAERMARDPVEQSKKLLKSFEGFIPKAKWDVNAFRVGFGSDTVTRQDGTVQRVTADTRVSMDDALRDLGRRIDEFQKVIKEQIGTDRFAAFGAEQQAALTSIAYNYGRLPDRIIEAVKNGTSEDIKAAVMGLAGDNQGINSDRRKREANILGQPNLAVEADTDRQMAEILKKQTDYKTKIDEAVDAREVENEYLKQQTNLIGDALLAKQKEQFVNQEVVKAQADADKLDILRDDPEWVALIARIKEAAAAYFDLQHAKEKATNARTAVEQPVQDLTAQRDALQEQIEFLRNMGNFGMADNLLPQLDAINAKLAEAIQKAIVFWREVIAGGHGGAAAFGMTADQIRAMITALETAGLSTAKLQTIMGVTKQQIADTFTNSAVNALDQFAQAVANGENVFKSLGRALRTFAADFLIQMGQMILKAIIFKAIMSALGIPTTPAPVKHGGGVIGMGGDNRKRSVSPMWFSTAMRYHSGGIAGLRPDEVPAVLKRGEEVLTETDPRHRKNGGLNPQGDGNVVMPDIKIVNSIDSGDFVSEGLNTAKGQKAFMNLVRANRGALKQAMNG